MSTLQHKLTLNKFKIKRDKHLKDFDQKFSDFLADVEFSGEADCIKYAAFSKWDDKSGVRTTSRGDLKNWNHFTFNTWNELMSVLKKFQQVKNYIGWFFIDADGPYYKMSINAFLSHIQSISNYATNNDRYDFGWVGGADDVGIIIGHNQPPSKDNKFRISIWGI